MKKLILLISLLLLHCLSLHFNVFSQILKLEKDDSKISFFEAEDLLLSGNYDGAIDKFLILFSDDTMNANIAWKIGKCYLSSSHNKSMALYYLKKAAGNLSAGWKDDNHLERKAPYSALFDLASAYHLINNIDSALFNYTKLRGLINNREKTMIMAIDRQMEMCRNALEMLNSPSSIIIKNLGAPLNTTYPEYSALVSGDESIIVFTSRRNTGTANEKDESGHYNEDIYISYRDTNNSWSEPVLIDTNINSAGHEASIGLSVDAQELFIYIDDHGDGNIYYSKLEGERWSKPSKLGSNINTGAWETHATLSSDRQLLYFVSDRPGGYGGRDIYRSIEFPNGQWSRAQNLGPVINTPYDEDAPFIHPDGVTLYFSSNGHKSMGGFDIFFSEKNNQNTWTEPVNMGYPVNTTDDDIFFVTSSDGKRGYLSSVRPEGMGEKDIYMVSFPEAEEKTLTVLTGILNDQFGLVPENARITVFDINSGEPVGVYKPNSKTGKYLLILPQGKNYDISYEGDGFLFKSERLYVPEKSAYLMVENTVQLKPVRTGEKIVLNNLFFEYNEASLKPESAPELQKLYDLLEQNKNIGAEISGHTDSKGDDKYNKNLSLQRANAVVTYISKMGISSDRLKAIGMGAAEPIAPNAMPDGTDNPEGRALNRRIELKIIRR